MIDVAEPIIGQEEKDAVNAVLASGMLAQGPRVAQLEEAFAKFCGTKYAVAANSGTAAIHMALFAAGIGPGDEVITTPFSFIATVNPIIVLGARPVFADIDPQTFNLDTEQLEKAITPKTRAILPVDLYGQPYDYKELRDIKTKHDLVIVEDACQAIGARYQNKKAGSLGHLGCFSLYATKNIMSGEGGIVTTNNEKYALTMKSFRQHGMKVSGDYEYKQIGYNYRLSELHAAIALEQLKKVDDFNQARAQNASLLDEGLKDVPGIITPKVAAGRSHVYHQYTIRVTPQFPLSRNDLARRLQDKGVGTRIYYPKPLHVYPHIAKLGYKSGDFPEAERASAEVLSLPVHPRVKSSQLRFISDVITSLGKTGK